MSRTPFVPIPIFDVDLEQPVPAPRHRGPARLLVRRERVPVAFIPFELTERHAGAADLREEIRGVLPAVAPRPRTPAEPPGLRVSVVVTACVASDELGDTLRGLARQSVAPHEVVLVDNRPGASRIPALLGTGEFPHVRLVESARRGVSQARNDGLAAVTGDVVAYTDDDVLVDTDWVRWIADAFADPAVGCVTGLVLPAELETFPQTLFERFGGYSKGYAKREFTLDPRPEYGRLYPYAAGIFGTGANSAFRVPALRAVGGFDEFLGTGTPARGGEDLDIHLTMIRSGHRIVYEPAALIRHRHHRDLPDLRRQLFGYGVGLSAMITKRLCSGREERAQLLRRLAPGLRHLLSPSSAKNSAKDGGFPLDLTVAELLGIAYGPVAYCRSRLSAPR